MRMLKVVAIRRFLGCAAVVLAATGPAQAVTLLATGFGDNDGSGARCFAINVGATPVRVNSIKLIRFDGSELALDSGNCSFPGNIFPALACQITGVSGSGAMGPLRCVIEVATSTGAKNIRGTLVVHPFTGLLIYLDAR